MSTEGTGAMMDPKKPSSLQEIKRKAREASDRLSVILEIVRGTLDVILGPVPTVDEHEKETATPNGLLEEIHRLLDKNIKNLEFLEKQVKNIEREVG